MRDSPDVVVVGRSTSHYTRVVRMLAHELGVPVRLEPLFDMTLVDADDYGGNPALKLPTLRIANGDGAGSRVFGTENICRALARLASPERRVVWGEDLDDDVSCNVSEMAWHGMQAQVQLIFGTMIAKLPDDNVYFAKARAGFGGALAYVDAHLDDVVARLPPRDVALVEIVVFCLVDHIVFREAAGSAGREAPKTVSIAPYAALRRFHAAFGARPSAQATAYAFDVRPT